MKIRALILGVTCLAPVAAFCADAPPPPPENEWVGSGQAGYSSSSGNSSAKAANAALDAAYFTGPWKHAAHIGGLYGESANIVSAERWDLGWQSNYDLTPVLYTFGGLHYMHDMFSGFQYQESVTGGVGFKVFNTDATKLDVQVGAGYKRLRPETLNKVDGVVVSRTPLEVKDGVIGTLGVNFSQALTSTTTLTDKLLVETGSMDTLIANTLAVAVKISTKLALSAGYTLQDNTKPPTGLKKIDTLETLSLVYSF